MTLSQPMALVGDSTAMQRVRALLARVAPTPVSVLLEGPTGSGKELAAHALHAASGLPGRMVAVNVCAIPDAMFEDVLFGHARGAFTGAAAEHAGYLSEAHRGTLFLDEISGLATPNQAKLLRAVETKEFRPLGSRVDSRSAFRLVCATNVPLVECEARGALRTDLIQRIAGIIIRLPALRDRLDDIRQLVPHFLAELPTPTPVEVTAAAVRALYDHHWPGNVRELRNVIQRAAILSDGGIVDTAQIAAALGAESTISTRILTPEEFTHRRLMEVLEETGWDLGAAASRLGMHRTTLWRRLRRGGGELPPPNRNAGVA